MIGGGLSLLTIMALGTAAFAGGIKNTVVPYGDYSAECTHYGWSAVPHPIVVYSDQAQDALSSYFSERGMSVRHVLGVGRFIRADVVRDDKVVDTIIYDRRTGRIRSIY